MRQFATSKKIILDPVGHRKPPWKSTVGQGTPSISSLAMLDSLLQALLCLRWIWNECKGQTSLGHHVYVDVEHAHHKFSWLLDVKCFTHRFCPGWENCRTSLIFHFFSLQPPFWQTLVLLRIDEPSQTNQRRHLAKAPCKWTNRINLSARCA